MVTLTNREYQQRISVAETAVADVADPQLKQVAFAKILEQLLSQSADERQPATASGRQTTRSRSLQRSHGTMSRGPVGLIEALLEEQFFQQGKSLRDVQTELQNRGHRIPRTSLSGPLQALLSPQAPPAYEGDVANREVSLRVLELVTITDGGTMSESTTKLSAEVKAMGTVGMLSKVLMNQLVNGSWTGPPSDSAYLAKCVSHRAKAREPEPARRMIPEPCPPRTTVSLIRFRSSLTPRILTAVPASWDSLQPTGFKLCRARRISQDSKSTMN